MGRNDRDIAIVGMSCIFPEAAGAEQFWNNLVNGVDSVKDVPTDRIDPEYLQYKPGAVDRFYCKKGAFITPPLIDPARYGILPIAAEGYDPEHMAMMMLSFEALEDAGVFEKNIPLNKGCIVLGKGNFAGISMLRAIDVIHTTSQVLAVIKNLVPEIPDEELEKFKKYYQESKGRYQADSAIGAMPNLIASLVANKLDMQGPAYTIDGACASSLIAIDHCIQYLLSGQCDIALAGGTHLGQSAIFWSIFNMLGAMSRTDKSAPLSEDADGLIVGEGSGMIILKRLDKAIADKDRIYAVIKGSAICSDGAGVSVMAPNTKGQRQAIIRAWDGLDIKMDDVSYIEAHGTATVVGDRTEIHTLTELFGNEPGAREIKIGSVKSNIGHIMPAAGMAGVMKTALSLYHRKFVPTLHCERPAKAVMESRFRPVQETMDWNEDEFPLIAGVNAFGFGGVNGHVVMTAYKEEKSSMHLIPEIAKEEVVAATAKSKEELIKKLSENHFTTNPDDNYRIVIFDPTIERIQKAKGLVEKDKPWRGRLDIWFSNEPLLKEEGKLAFLFPGYDPDSQPELDTLVEAFGVERRISNKESNIGLDYLLNLYYNSQTLDKSLKAADIKPDMYAGHSLGEWHAIRAAGLSNDESVEGFFNSVDATQKHDDLEEMIYIATGCGYDRIKDWVEEIPKLYLANDNCPNQVLLCGTRKAADVMIEILRKEQIYFQEMSYQSGYHTPFLKDKMYIVHDAMQQIKLDQIDTPLWSATTLEQYPTDLKEFTDLTVQHLTTPVRFRELVIKLYEEENARVFIQVGRGGGLTGFVDDILKDRPYSIIAASSTNRTGIEQLRRALALLFIEGREINREILGIKEGLKLVKPVKGMNMRMFIPVIKDLPMLRDAAAKYRPAGVLSPLDSMFDDKSHPILSAVNKNLQDAIKLQNEMVTLFKQRGLLDQPGTLKMEKEATKKAEAEPLISKAAPKEEKKTLSWEKDGVFEEDINIFVDDYPYLYDHSIVHQPKNWMYMEDLNPVIPMTMTLELLAETASKYMPGKKVISIDNSAVYKWMSVEKPFINKYVGKRKDENTVHITIEGHARGDIVFADEYPEVPEKYRGYIDLGKQIMEPPTREKIYDYYLFHGPKYQCVQEVTEVSERGLRARLKKPEGKGSLLDSMGQLLGTYTHLTVDEDRITFPVGLKRLTFYQDMNDQEGDFEYTLIVTELNPYFIIGDVIIKRDGKVWCIFEQWQNRRFEFDPVVWDVVMRPQESILADEIRPGVYYFNNRYTQGSSWDFLLNRYLNSPERKKFHSMLPNQRRYYLISRVPTKDAVRNLLEKKEEEKNKYCYPIEIFINYDEKGRPIVSGPCEEDAIKVSIAHKKGEAVAVASTEKPVGIDLERIEERSPEFMDISFTDHEKSLLKDLEPNEWSTRFWTAKEAFAKMKGTGLEGKPRRYEVERIEGEDLYIQGTRIETFRFKEDYIVGYIL